MAGGGDKRRQAELALESPIMHAALCEVRQLTAMLSDRGDREMMQQVLAILNAVNEQLYGMLSGGAETVRNDNVVEPSTTYRVRDDNVVKPSITYREERFSTIPRGNIREREEQSPGRMDSYLSASCRKVPRYGM